MTPLLFPDELPIILNLIRTLPVSGKVVEWGSGGSTIEFLKNLSDKQTLISIEHNKTWFDLVHHELILTKQTNWTYFYKPELPFLQHGYASPTEENPLGLDEYIYPNDSVLDGDLFFIDGIGRTSIALMLLAKAKNRNAIILMHDYAEKAHFYNWVVRLFPSSERLGTSLIKLNMI